MKKLLSFFSALVLTTLLFSVFTGCEEEGAYPKLTVTNASSNSAVTTVTSKQGISGKYDTSKITAKVIVGAQEFDITSLAASSTEAKDIDEMDLFNGTLQVIFTDGATETVLYEIPMLSTRIASNSAAEKDKEYTFTFNLEEDSFTISGK